MPNRKYQECMNAIKVFAILLVFNSHCDGLYPASVSWMATGGAVGNALFFIISGYLVSFRAQEQKGIKWIGRKLLRLYPVTLIVAILRCVLFAEYPSSVMDFVFSFLWPTSFWFVGALLLFYVLFCFLEKPIRSAFPLFSVILWAVYFLYYIFLVDQSVWSVEAAGLTSVAGCFKLIYYFYIFCLGYYLKCRPASGRQTGFGLLAIGSFLFSFVFKFLLQKNIVPMQTQFLSQIIGVVFAYSALRFCLAAEEGYRARIPQKLRALLNRYSACSLEMFLLQFSVIELFAQLGFPINIILAFVSTTVLALLYHRFVSEKIAALVRKASRPLAQK